MRKSMLYIAVLVAAFLAVNICAAQADEANVVIDAADYIDMEASDCGLQAAINAAYEAGGGTVKIPAGVFPLRRGLVIKSNVALEGAGMDETMLVTARKIHRLNPIRVQGPDDWIYVDHIPDGVEVGSAMSAFRDWPHKWVRLPVWVKEIDREAKAIKLESPHGFPGYLAQTDRANPFLAFGDTAAPARDIAKGDAEIHLENASMFQPGDELTLGGTPGNDSRDSHVFVREVKGNTIVLESPAPRDFPAFPERGNAVASPIFALFPLIHGWDVKNASIRDLTVRGQECGYKEVGSATRRFTLAGIHIYNSWDLTLERVAVRKWQSDGFSLQHGGDLLVKDCEATDNLGNGFHPGTGPFINGEFIRIRSERNGGDGLHYCWHNRNVNVRDSVLSNNSGHGIGKLGAPGNINSDIEGNTIERNGRAGIWLHAGGEDPKNVFRGNTIRDNSQSEPGAWPGILISALDGQLVHNILVEENIIESALDEPTQWIGVEERHVKASERNAEHPHVVNGYFLADHNRIINNKLSGHKTADILVRGPNTVFEGNEGKVVEERFEPADNEDEE